MFDAGGRSIASTLRWWPGLLALALALKAVRLRLTSLRRTFTWEFAEEGDTGFPIYVPDGLGQDFARRMEALIEAEVERFTSQAKIRGRK